MDTGDICPSAVLVGSPFPMIGNCSTRDGRMRIAGPKNPHRIWRRGLPEALNGGTIVGADASGGVYLAVIGPPATVGRVDGANGDFSWVTSLPGVGLALVSFVVTRSGALQALDLGGSNIFSFDPFTGASTTIPLAISVGATTPGVGSEGSLYAQYISQTSPMPEVAVVSRILPDGTVAWTSENFAGPTFNGFSTLALGQGDAVITVSGNNVTELASDTGAVVWTTTLGPSGDPRVGPDGSIFVGGYILDPRTGVPKLPNEFVYAIAANGTLVVATNSGIGLAAISPDGSIVELQGIGPGLVLLDTTGEVIANGLAAASLTTGDSLWAINESDNRQCIATAAVPTSAGGVVGLDCFGALYGESD